MSKQLGFYVDLQGCTGCKACQIACKDKNGLEVSLLWRCVIEINGGEWLKLGDTWQDNTFTYNLSTACMHCEQPICREVCPTLAISKRADGVVLIDANRCMGLSLLRVGLPLRRTAIRSDHWHNDQMQPVQRLS